MRLKNVNSKCCCCVSARIALTSGGCEARDPWPAAFRKAPTAFGLGLETCRRGRRRRNLFETQLFHGLLDAARPAKERFSWHIIPFRLLFGSFSTGRPFGTAFDLDFALIFRSPRSRSIFTYPKIHSKCRKMASLKDGFTYHFT